MTEKPVALPSQQERKLDGKFSIRGGQIVNTVSGEAIPEDEPLFLLRGRDNNALEAIQYYASLCHVEGCNDLHLAGIDQTAQKFSDFGLEHPERMKQPGITKHLKLDVALPSSPAPWIPVNEKLPELTHTWKDGPHIYSESATVLAFDTSCGMRVATREGSGCWSEAAGDILRTVTHWMPLPSPPVSSEKAASSPAPEFPLCDKPMLLLRLREYPTCQRKAGHMGLCDNHRSLENGKWVGEDWDRPVSSEKAEEVSKVEREE